MHQLDFVYSNIETSSIVVSLLLDFKKPLDCIDHSVLLAKLDSFSIRSVAKQQSVSLDHVESSKSLITLGVPQSSILDTLVFLIFFKDLPSCAKLL